MADLRDQLLERLPDGPSTVQMRALLELGETQLFGDVEGAVFTHAEAGLGGLYGHPSLTGLTLPPELLAFEPVELEGSTWERLCLSTYLPLPAGERADPEARRLTPELWPQVPPSLSATLATAMERRAVFCALVDGQPVSFAWAPLRSERWFDLWVETMPVFRRQGLGRAVASAVIHHEHSEGRAPVWGAPASNAAALALGRSLGFVDCAQTLWRATKRV